MAQKEIVAVLYVALKHVHNTIHGSTLALSVQ